jgi:hypothetical protein
VIHPDVRDTAKSKPIETGEQRRKRLVRNARQRELYGPTHRRRRREFIRRLKRGEEVLCPRCGLPVGIDQQWDLGHDDLNPEIERVEHTACNRAAPNRLKTSREW